MYKIKTGGTVIGYKLLKSDLGSLSSEYGRHMYSSDWTEVPGHGAYVGLTLPGLLRGGMGQVLAECEYAQPTEACADGDVVTARRVRVLRHAPIDTWAVVRAVVWGVRQVAHLSPDPRTMAAIEAAERCERERTPDAAAEAAEAAAAARAAAWAADAAAAAAAWAARAAAWAADAARAAADAARAAAWAAGAAWASAGAAGAAWAAEAAAETDLARRILEHLVDQVLTPAPVAKG